jgi:hypothetical protein
MRGGRLWLSQHRRQWEIMMGFRIVFGSIVAFSAMAALTLECSAAEVGEGYRARAQSRPHSFYYGGYFGQIGGHSYGVVPDRFFFLNESTYNYPGHYNNQTFWERVQTQRNYPVQY